GWRRFIRWALLFAAGAWLAAGIYLGEITLRLPRKLPQPVIRWEVAPPEDVEITAADGLKMRAWVFRRAQANRGALILLHGQTDNRVGMLGYANLFLRQGYNTLVPDLRAHGASDGELATYGFREADDVHRWVDWMMAKQPGGHVFGLGESMGAAILLQS